MLPTEWDAPLTSDEAIEYLRISKPTFLKYIRQGRIRAVRAGKGWRILQSELNRFLQGGFEEASNKKTRVTFVNGRSIGHEVVSNNCNYSSFSCVTFSDLLHLRSGECRSADSPIQEYDLENAM